MAKQDLDNIEDVSYLDEMSKFTVDDYKKLVQRMFARMKDTNKEQSTTQTKPSNIKENTNEDIMSAINKGIELLEKQKHNEPLRQLFKHNGFDYDKDTLYLPKFMEVLSIPNTNNVKFHPYITEGFFCKGTKSFFDFNIREAGE